MAHMPEMRAPCEEPLEINVVRYEKARCLKLNKTTTTTTAIATADAHKICMQILNYIIVPMYMAPLRESDTKHIFNSSDSILYAFLMKVKVMDEESEAPSLH